MKNLCLFLFFLLIVQCLNNQLKKAEKSEIRYCSQKYYIQSFDNSFLNSNNIGIGLSKFPNFKTQNQSDSKKLDLDFDKNHLFTITKVDDMRYIITASNNENLMLKKDHLINEDLHDKITLIKMKNEKNEDLYKIRFENNECLVNHEDKIKATNCDLKPDFDYGKIHQGLYFKLIPYSIEGNVNTSQKKKQSCVNLEI